MCDSELKHRRGALVLRSAMLISILDIKFKTERKQVAHVAVVVIYLELYP